MTIAEAVAHIDEVTADLKFARQLVDDLMRIVASVESERDYWRACYEAAQ